MAPRVVGTAGAGTPGEHAPTGLLVFAAASLSDALEEVDLAFTARTGVRVNASYAASSVLAKQAKRGVGGCVLFCGPRVGRLPRGFDLAAALGGGRLATADPDSVRAGEYARR
jgi:molybdate transport system substrate-binding protein